MLIGSRGCRIEWYNFRRPWVTPNPGFNVTGYLKIEYLADGATVFNCTNHSCRSLGATENVQKKLGVVAEIFLLKALEGVLHQRWKYRVSLRWNFYTDIQLIRGRFWLQLWTVKKFSEPRVSWKYFAKMWKNSKMQSQFAATLHRWADRRSLLG